MPISTEVFVMAIFFAGGPFFYILLKDTDLQGRQFFMATYVCLTISNIFTVVEEFCCHAFFNLCEHIFIALASTMMLAAVVKLTAKSKPLNVTSTPHE